MSMSWCSFFFFKDTATTEIYTLSLHDALPILSWDNAFTAYIYLPKGSKYTDGWENQIIGNEIGSTRLNSSHITISYAVFCLKKKNRYQPEQTTGSGWRRTRTTCSWRTTRQAGA